MAFSRIQVLSERGTADAVAQSAVAALEREQIGVKSILTETLLGGLTLAATPARHFSGRGLFDGDETLWSSWVIAGPTRRVFFSGDTGMFRGFAEIGHRYGPFDATLIETGGYSVLWADVHLGPEQAVRAHQELRGRVLVPIH